jgi:LuxR family transcriptional regulator, maltose regulon positive regulatory protein
VLHRRAAAWHRHAGEVEAAIHHATAAGEFGEAGGLIVGHWLSYFRQGRVATVVRWLSGLPDDVIAGDPWLALPAAWIGALRGASRQESERWLVAAEGSSHPEPPPQGLAFDVAMTRAVYIFDDVGRSLQATRRALELADPESSEEHASAATVLGRNLYLSGQAAEAQAVLEKVARRMPSGDKQPYVMVNLLALLSLLAGEQGDDERAWVLARRAMGVAEARGLSFNPLNGIAYIALARAEAGRGGLAEAERLLEQALQVFGIDSFAVQYAQALLELAGVRHARGNTEGAGALEARARELIGGLVDPGMLPAFLARAERAVRLPTGRRPAPAAALTERELVVLRLLTTRLSQREIAGELYVSVNTVRTHIQGIHRKLGVTSRAETIARARELDLLPAAP